MSARPGSWSRSLSDADLVQTEADSILFFLVKSESPQSRTTRATAVFNMDKGLSSPPPPQGPAGTNYFENIVTACFQSIPKMWPFRSPLLLFNLLLHTSFTIVSCLISLHLAKTSICSVEHLFMGYKLPCIVLGSCTMLASISSFNVLFLDINLIQLFQLLPFFFFFPGHTLWVGDWTALLALFSILSNSSRLFSLYSFI